MPAFVEEYFSGKNSGKFDGLLQQYTSQLDNSELHLRGFALALGSLPQKLLQGNKNPCLWNLFWLGYIVKVKDLYLRFQIGQKSGKIDFKVYLETMINQNNSEFNLKNYC